MRIIGAIMALLLGATFASADPPRVTPAETKFVAAPFCVAIVFEPVKLDKSATAAGLPIGDAWKVLEGMTDTDVKAFERVIVLIDPLPGGNVAFMPAFVLRYPAGTDAKKKLPALLGGEVKEAKLGDVTYVYSTKYKMAMVEMAGYAVDDRTVLIAPSPTLEVMLKAAGDKDRPLAAELAKLDLARDVGLVITPAPALKRIAEIEKESGKKTDDPTFTAVRTALEKTAAITVTLDFGKNPLVRAEFRCADADAAAVVHTTLKDLLAKAKDAYPDARKDLEKMFSPEAKALLPLIDEAVRGYTLTKTGSTVVLTADRPKSPTPKP